MFKRSLRGLLAGILSLSLLCSLTACGGNSDASDPTKKDTLTVVTIDDIGSFDPHEGTGFEHHQVTRQIYETLVVRDENMELQPWLATDWEWEDDVTLLLHLREGVKFTNGEELKASDVVFTIEHALTHNTAAAVQFSHIDLEKTEALDAHTVKVVLTGPFPTQVENFENPLASIINEKAFNDFNGEYGTVESAVGTGPYIPTQYNVGDSVVLKANEDYWIPDQPKIKNVVFRFIQDSASRAIEAETGGADIVYDIGVNDIERLKSNPKLTYVNADGLNTCFIAFNCKDAILSDIRCRQAIWYGIDLPAAIQIAYRDFGSLATGIFSPGLDGRHPDLTPYFVDRDVEKAKALLAEAGYPDGFEIEIMCENSSQSRMDFCEAIQSQLAEVGITLKLNFMADAAAEEIGLSGRGQLYIYGFTASTGEVGRNIQRWLPEFTESGMFQWENAEFEEVVRKALVTIDPEERYELYYRGQEILMENFVALPMWTKELNAVTQSYVKGFYIMPTYEQHYLQNVYFE